MSISIIITVLISTFIHALWNFFIKKSKFPYENLQLLALFSGLLSIPFGLYFIIFEGFSKLGFFLSLTSGFIHIFYFYFLGKAYQNGDLSYVYPVSRGTAVALVPIVGIFYIKDPVDSFAIFGIGIVLLGILILGNNTFKSIKKTELKFLALPFFIGLSISFYTIVDYFAVSLINPIFVFSFSSFIGGFISITIIDKRIYHFYTIFSNNITFILLISAMSAIAYSMILFSYKQSYVSLVAPLREISVVFASILGIVYLKEQVSYFKIFGILLIVIGAVLIT
jgi:uncharacterized membrane protein|tara:strand:- start:1586 stop:2428 length:843 start_codon:yes stop_codon:yes gene_type:complete